MKRRRHEVCGILLNQVFLSILEPLFGFQIYSVYPLKFLPNGRVVLPGLLRGEQQISRVRGAHQEGGRSLIGGSLVSYDESRIVYVTSFICPTGILLESIRRLCKLSLLKL